MASVSADQITRKHITDDKITQDISMLKGQQASEAYRRLSKDERSLRSRRSNRSIALDEPPRFVIDLSLPPEQRYLEVCNAFKSEMLNLTSLFDEVVGGMVHFLPIKWLRLLCRIFLRRVYSDEENAELKGISQATGVDMYLLTCFNVLLDLLMGCSSGGAVVRAGAELRSGRKMVHFRTLDWGMDELRRVVVQLDYVLEKDGPVIASSITYAGFVGVLTGVRKDLSMSLNFRPNRIDSGKFVPDMRYRWHLLMVLLGRRSSISSSLRQALLPQREEKRQCGWRRLTKGGALVSVSYSDVVRRFGGDTEGSGPTTTTACYLCFSDGKETAVIEKDRISAKLQRCTAFTIVTNGDEELVEGASIEKTENPAFESVMSMQEILEEARDREWCARTNWTSMCIAKMRQLGLNVITREEEESLMDVDDVIKMVQLYPTTNECTHFACVMDPTQGTVKWCRRWMHPVNAKWIQGHIGVNSRVGRH